MKFTMKCLSAFAFATFTISSTMATGAGEDNDNSNKGLRGLPVNEEQARELTSDFPKPSWAVSDAAPIKKKPKGLSANSVGQIFERPAWAQDGPGAASHDYDEQDQRVFVKYASGAKRDMLADFEEADQQERDDVAGKNPNFANAGVSKAKPLDIKFDFDDMDTLVVEGTQRKLKWLMNNFPSHIVSVEDDSKRYFNHGVETTQDGAGRNLQTSFSDQVINGQMRPYGIAMVQAPGVWAKGATGNGVKVCVIDSGIDASNPDFVTANLSGADDNGNSWDVDTCSHGTHCAGTIGAKNDNDGVVGVAYDVEFFIERVFAGGSNGCSWSYSSSLMNAATRCKNNGARIISMSLGGGGSSTSEGNLFKSLLENDGVLSIAAAGNDGDSGMSYPASYESIMSVAAVDRNMNKAGFSQFNTAVDIAAPGVSTLSVKSGGSGSDWSSKSGTSMATPHVAGVAALLLGAFDDANNKFGAVAAIRSAMESTAMDRGTAGYDTSYGWGVVQALSAYECLESGSCVAQTSAPTPTPIPCNDTPIGWYDRDGPVYDCAWYASGDNCSNYGNGYSNCDGPGGADWTLGDGTTCPTANIACCVCGGGQDEVGEDTPAPTKSPTTSPTASPTKSPTASPTKVPTASPTKSPTGAPTKSPIASITSSPTGSPVKSATSSPTKSPTAAITAAPTDVDTDEEESDLIWEEIETEGFENGWGAWNDGGSDARRSANDAQYCNTGTFCVRLRDNTGTSTMTHDAMDLSQFEAIRIEFSFYVRSFENNEDFFLEIRDPSASGGAWQIVEDWKRTAAEGGVSNNQFYDDIVEVDSSAFGAGTQIRFRADASGNADWVYIDDVTISGGIIFAT